MKTKTFPFLTLIMIFSLILSVYTGNAQALFHLTLNEAYSMAESNYPLVKEKELLEKSKDFSVQNIIAGVLPQIGLSAQATYQSDVTKITIPGYNIPSIGKDQYKAYGEVSQTLTDFILNKQQREMAKNNYNIQDANINTELNKLKERINQLYFGVLLVDGQLEQNDITKKDISSVMDKVKAAINNGTDFRTNLDKLKAELLKAEQRDIELKGTREAYTLMLGNFINQTLDANTKLDMPSNNIMDVNINRPELKYYALQKNNAILQVRLNNAKNYPKLNLFFQGGVGQPSPVNLLLADLSPYYITGIRLNWNLGGLYTLRKDNLLARNDFQISQIQENTFLFNTKLSRMQYSSDVFKLRELIATDDEIIALRESIKNTAKVQLENGIISTNDYLKEVTAVDQARQNQVLHKIQLLQSIYNYNTTGGN